MAEKYLKKCICSMRRLFVNFNLLESKMRSDIERRCDLERMHIDLEKLNEELCIMQQKASAEEKRRRYVEDECAKLKRRVLGSCDGFEDKISYTKKNVDEVPSAFEYAMCLPKAHQPRETLSSQKNTISKILEEGKIKFDHRDQPNDLI
ncbi:hypothetical protein Syun_011146 [Stephania yunnanensis]|uniref:Uncharacterized protein n=1 Tax=Stephania yunnanensis TaxID=152371 RepID=A0AAP0PI78_9MAGN